MTGLENGTERAMNTFRADLCFVSALEYKYDADLSDIQNGFLRRFMTEFDQLGKDQRGEVYWIGFQGLWTARPWPIDF